MWSTTVFVVLTLAVLEVKPYHAMHQSSRKLDRAAVKFEGKQFTTFNNVYLALRIFLSERFITIRNRFVLNTEKYI